MLDKYMDWHDRSSRTASRGARWNQPSQVQYTQYEKRERTVSVHMERDGTSDIWGGISTQGFSRVLVGSNDPLLSAGLAQDRAAGATEVAAPGASVTYGKAGSL